MEIYAGMVENLDANVGRIIQYLKQNNLYDNTLIFFVSDNGAEGFVRGSYGSESGFDNSVTNVGTLLLTIILDHVGPRSVQHLSTYGKIQLVKVQLPLLLL